MIVHRKKKRERRIRSVRSGPLPQNLSIASCGQKAIYSQTSSGATNKRKSQPTQAKKAVLFKLIKASEISSLRKEQDALTQMKALVGTKGAGKKIFEKVFNTDIHRLLTMEDMWKGRQKPTPIHLKEESVQFERGSVGFDQIVWTMKENTSIFLESLETLGKDLLLRRKSNPSASVEFDKDDEVSLNFVTATANLRASIYHIAPQSRFTVKQMAGNIIPAIATTNAIIAGMIVMLALKFVTDDSSCNNTFLAYGGVRKHYLLNEPASGPNPRCVVCSNAYLVLNVDSSTTTLRALVDYLGNPDTKPTLEGELTINNGDVML